MDKCKGSNESLTSSAFNVHFFMDYLDINWYNCFVKKQSNLIFTWILRFILFFILIFLTTPAAFLEIMRFNQLVTNLTSFLNPENNNRIFKYIFFSYIPPLIVLGVNNVILFLIFRLSNLKSTVGKSKSFFVIPDEYFESGIFLLFFQYVNSARLINHIRIQFLSCLDQNFFFKTNFAEFLQSSTGRFFYYFVNATNIFWVFLQFKSNWNAFSILFFTVDFPEN